MTNNEINIENLSRVWKTDSNIDITKMDSISANVPSLHSKYISLLSECKKKILQVERDYLKMRRLRTSYYNGTMTREELHELGWDQWLEKRPLKTVLDELLMSDDILMEIATKKEELTICKEFLESVMKSIHSRTYDVKNIIEWYKYSNGMT